MLKETCKELKMAIIDAGVDAIEDFLGADLQFNSEEDLFEAMDNTLDQMPEDVFFLLYRKYCKYDTIKKEIWMNGAEAIDEILGDERNLDEDPDVTDARLDSVLMNLTDDEALVIFKKYLGSTKRLHISMAYTFVGDTGIDIPKDLLEGKSEEDQLKIAYEYAQDHIDNIPVARNAEYILHSDSFELEDIDFV